MGLLFKRFWKESPLKTSYDAVIIGGGLHGMASAYFLASRYGLTDVAVIDKKFIGCGAAGRNTAIVRANQRTQENIPII
jgi:sarcosine oxidase, subunit beta